MFVYRFKVPPIVIDSNTVRLLLDQLETLKKEEDKLDWLPSKTDIMFASQRSITDTILEWSKNSSPFSFEYEEHNDDWRTLTQVYCPEEGMNTISTHFLLPLFPFDFYLTF